MKLQPWVLPTLTGVIGAGLGFATGVMVANHRRNSIENGETVKEQLKQLELEFEEDMAKVRSNKSSHPTNYRGFNVIEQQVEEGYDIIADGDDFCAYDFDDDGNAFAVREEREEVDYTKVPGVLKLEVEVSPGVTNIFTTNLDWDYTEECKKRTPFMPYVIHQDEFMSNESELDQTSLNYYQADDIMTDDKDDIVTDYLKTVGELKFGHGSTDSNIFFVRNEKLRLEFEVCRSFGSYQEEVLGEIIETKISSEDLKHSKKSTKKFKME